MIKPRSGDDAIASLIAIAIVLLVIVATVAGVLYFLPTNGGDLDSLSYDEWGERTPEQPLEPSFIPAKDDASISGEIRVALVYLYTNNIDPEPEKTLAKMRDLAAYENAGHYSVKSLYAKAGVKLTFDYRAYSVPTPLLYDKGIPGFSGWVNSDGYDHFYNVIASWGKASRDDYNVLHDRCDHFLFVVRSGVSAGGTDGWYLPDSRYTVVGNYNDEVTRHPEAFRFVIAHELGHAFGGRDTYGGIFSWGLFANDAEKRSVMNNGGDGQLHLTKGGSVDTDFGGVNAPFYMHFDKIEKTPKDYFGNLG